MPTDQELLAMPDMEYQAYRKKKVAQRKAGLREPEPHKGMFRLGMPKANRQGLAIASSGIVRGFFGISISPPKEKKQKKKR